MVCLLPLTQTKHIPVWFHYISLRSDLKFRQLNGEPCPLAFTDFQSSVVLPSHPRLSFDQKDKWDVREKAALPLPSSHQPVAICSFYLFFSYFEV